MTDHIVQLLAGRSPRDARFLPSLVISITKKCPYRCEHCYAIKSLGSRDTISVQQMLGVVRQMQQRGLGVIAWEGGEPLLRFDDLVTMIRVTYPAISARALIEDDDHFGCCACNGLCYIDSAGNLQACDLLQISFGNVRKQWVRLNCTRKEGECLFGLRFVGICRFDDF